MKKYSEDCKEWHGATLPIIASHQISSTFNGLGGCPDGHVARECNSSVSQLTDGRRDLGSPKSPPASAKTLVAIDMPMTKGHARLGRVDLVKRRRSFAACTESF